MIIKGDFIMTASKTKRLLYFMSELEKGNDISKTDYLARFGISERTLKEDVSELKENLTGVTSKYEG